MTKFCSKCKIEKPLEMFHRDCRTKDGRISICKECRNIAPENKQRRTNNLKPYIRECNRCGASYTIKSYRQKYCESCQQEINKELCNNYYHKNKVLIGREHLKGENANGYKNGIGLYMRLAKKENACCSRCGSKAFLLVHHLDRNRDNNLPSNLEVLCKSCHQKEHVERDELGKFAGSKPSANNMC